ncbi:preprotein translocase subunit SecA [Candidatus Uhrbacteria bacterium]|nr:preprotein translocase subunit SecA [Candidatus Uhrbacteria bacterium]
MSVFHKIFGDPNARVIRSLDPVIEEINGLEEVVKEKTDEQLAQATKTMRDRSAGGQTLDDILPEVFANVREAAVRQLGQRPYDTQLKGGMVLHRGQIAEMKTGEGKTLAATLAVSLNAVAGNGVHVVTVNDYLAKRDAQWMGRVYNAVGLTVSCIGHEVAYQFDPTAEDHLKRVPRKQAYACDITYGTNNEFGFDYLRDNMVMRLEDQVQRGHHYAVVDEIDSILVDEARTPLIISAPAEESTEQYYQFAKIVRSLTPEKDYTIDEKMKSAVLTEQGIERMEKILGIDNLYAQDLRMVHHVDQALKAEALYKLDRDYVVKDGEVIIVDEFTGRLMLGRRYSEGLHQAIEAKEGVAIQKESQTLATITFQNYFRLYAKLSGMTGTAATEAEEFNKIYKLEVVVLPTNKPMVRKDFPDRVYKNEHGKLMAVVEEIRERHAKGQPILVGTVSIAKNEQLSEYLNRAGIPFEMLNAKNHEREAAIIANAGRKGAITVATNMAGRGVDIILGGVPPESAASGVLVSDRTIEDWQREHDEVVGLGGLHVIGTERHESRRIDNQLRGRSGRQGDNGSSQFYLSMEDDIMRIFGGDRVKRLMERLGVPDDMPIENRIVTKSIETAQNKVENHNFEIRKRLLEYDDVANKQREVIYRRRREYLETPEKNHERIGQMIQWEVDTALSASFPDENGANVQEFLDIIRAVVPLDDVAVEKINAIAAGTNMTPWQKRNDIGEIVSGIIKRFDEQYQHSVVEDAKRRNLTNPEIVLQQMEASVLVRALDVLWIDHLDALDHLRQGIGLRGYGQRDPLVEYKGESFRMFNELLSLHQHDVVRTIFKVGLTAIQAQGVFERRGIQLSGATKTGDAVSGTSGQVPGASTDKVGRNDPCPCGSGKKYKKCHGG